MSDCRHDTPRFVPNGCGPKMSRYRATLWQKLKRLATGLLAKWLVPELWFHAECDCHDRAYAVGAVRASAPDARDLADGEFLAGMLEKAGAESWPLRPLARKIAYIYWEAVHLHGDENFAWCESFLEWRKQLCDLGVDPEEYLG